MRRIDREIADRSAIESIINRASVCRLALSEDDQPYIVPLCFRYKDNDLYFHTSPIGILRAMFFHVQCNTGES